MADRILTRDGRLVEVERGVSTPAFLPEGVSAIPTPEILMIIDGVDFFLSPDAATQLARDLVDVIAEDADLADRVGALLRGDER